MSERKRLLKLSFEIIFECFDEEPDNGALHLPNWEVVVYSGEDTRCLDPNRVDTDYSLGHGENLRENFLSELKAMGYHFIEECDVNMVQDPSLYPEARENFLLKTRNAFESRVRERLWIRPRGRPKKLSASNEELVKLVDLAKSAVEGQRLTSRSKKITKTEFASSYFKKIDSSASRSNPIRDLNAVLLRHGVTWDDLMLKAYGD